MDTKISSHLLVDGYIRYVETHLCKQIIPDVIHQLCIKYYVNVSKKIWFVSNNEARHPRLFYVSPDMDIQADHTLQASEQPATKLSIAMYDAKKPDQCVQLAHCARTALESGVHCCARLTLAKYGVLSNIAMLRNRGSVDVMFECKFACFANLFIEQPDSAQIIGYRWKLPSLPHDCVGCTAVYSSQHGLLAIGGQGGASKNSAVLRRLSFDAQEVNQQDEWKWNEVSRTDIARQYCSACFFGDHSQSLFITNGYQYGGTTNSQRTSGRPCMKRTECYNFEKDEWVLLKNAVFARQKTALYCDEQQRRVYVVAGVDGYGYSQNKFEMYDMHRNHWYRLTPTTVKHGAHAIAWFDEHRSVLCVASIVADTIECIDLRDTVAKWKVVYGNNAQQGLQRLLGTTTKFNYTDFVTSRLLKFD